MRWLIILSIALLILSGCSSEKELIKPDTGIKVNEEGNIVVEDPCDEGLTLVTNSITKETKCVVALPDYGTRCTKTSDCEGFCQGSNESTSSGKCSAEPKPVGCVIIVERGERFERCPE